MRVIEVKWRDAEILTSDYSIKKASKLEPPVRTTVGWLVSEQPEWIILATDRFEKGGISAPMLIPKGMIMEYYEYVEEK